MVQFRSGFLNVAKRSSVKAKIGAGVQSALQARVRAGKAEGRPRWGETEDETGVYHVNATGRRCLALRARGHTKRGIARLLGVDDHTVRRFLHRHVPS